MKLETFKSQGKLLISGEYVILDGALSLAVPTRFGQTLDVEAIEMSKIIWKSFNEQDKVWFQNEFNLNAINNQKQILDDDVSKMLIKILNTAKNLNPEFLSQKKGFKVRTKLDFPRNWGLGTSSTLINNIAQWTYVDAYILLENSFGGSGYDIACAQHITPITYQLTHNSSEKRIINEVNFIPSFREYLYFIHLNKKQNSREGIKHYHENKAHLKSAIPDISNITIKMISCNNLSNFETLLNQHESIISKITNQTPVKKLLFQDFDGAIKSLGAWGGDFILATSKENPTPYFNKKGFETIIPYNDMVF